MKNVKTILAIAIGAITLSAMVGGVSEAAAKKINRSVVTPVVKVTAPAPSYSYNGGSSITYATNGAIR